MQKRFTYDMLLPQYWLTWLGFALWYLMIRLLPFSVLMWLGGKLGRLVGRFVARRRLVVEKNIELCFPELSEQEQQDLVWKIFESTGRGFIDTGIAWFWPLKKISRLVELKGMEHLVKAHEEGQGVLLFTCHFTSLELCGGTFNNRYPFDNYGVYRAHKNKVYDMLMCHGRERHSKGLTPIPRDEVRAMAKVLRKGKCLMYLPDQDYGHKYSTFVPFFGIEAASITAPTQLAKLGKAKAMAYTGVRKPDNSGYLIEIFPDDFEGYGQDEVQDAKMVNDFFEARIREYPDQYLWAHRRFKSRPNKEDDFYRLERLKSFQRRNKRRQKWQEKKWKAIRKAREKQQ